MSAPLIWILFPAGVAILLWFIQRKERLVNSISVGVCLLLMLLAWQVAIGKPTNLGIFSFEVSSTLVLFGRKFILAASDRYYLMLIYGVGAVWFFAARIVQTHRYFLPVGLLFLTIMVAAQAVEPFLYAALLIEIGVLLSILIVAPVEGGVIQGVLRYLVFQTMALPFILLAGWAAGVVELNPSASPLLMQATLLLAMGFAFWLAVFPFNTWIPSLMSQTHPYLSGFVLVILLSEGHFLWLSFLDGFAWLRANPLLPQIVQVGGAATVVAGGLFAAFQTDLRRMMGYSIIIESGFVLLSLSIPKPLGIELFAASLVPRLIGFSTWGLALSIFYKNRMTLTFDGVSGAIKKFPVASLTLLIAYFSLAGVPLLAGFPVRQVLFENLAVMSTQIAIWVFLGNAGFIIGGIRMFISLVGGKESPLGELKEKNFERVLLLTGVLILILIGFFPNVFMPAWMNLSDVFERLR